MKKSNSKFYIIAFCLLLVIVGLSIFLKSKTYIITPEEITKYELVPNEKLTRKSEFKITVKKPFYKKISTPSEAIVNDKLYITLYAEGFPLDLKKDYTITMDDFTNEQLSKVTSVYIVDNEATEISNKTNDQKFLKVFEKNKAGD